MTEVPVKTRKKLIEVALPLEAINVASAHEKQPGIGAHPRGLHLWWARRPLAAARAVIFAQMVDDPSSYVDTLLSEPETRRAADRELKKRRELWKKRKAEFEAATGNEAGAVPEPGAEPTLEDCAADVERQRLFHIIEELVKWENTTNEAVLQKARDEIWQSWRRACLDNIDHPRAKELFDRHKLPAFCDPFAGGGALPLEAQRLGLEAYASDLNPVAVLINKAMIEIPPKFAGRPPVNPETRRKKDLIGRQWKGANGLAEDVRYYGKWMRNEAEKRIGHLYPKIEITAEMAKDRPDLKPLVGQKLTVIAWLWARTVKSPNPAFRDVCVPLASTFMLSTKPGKEAYVAPVIENGTYAFTVKVGTPKDPNATKLGTTAGKRAAFICLMSGTPVSYDHIRAEGKAGRMGVQLMAIVAEGVRGRVYLSPTEDHIAAAESAEPEWKPEIELPDNPRDFKTPNYGLTTFGDLFTPRQLVALNTFSNLVLEAREKAKADAVDAGLSSDGQPYHEGGVGADAYADVLSLYLTFTISRIADYNSSLATWKPSGEQVMQTYKRQALAMTWDFPDSNLLGEKGICWASAIKYTADNLTVTGLAKESFGLASQADSREHGRARGKVVSTDPPYYDNIGYADLSDFFYVWLRKSLRTIFPELLSTVSTPKADELVATPYRHGGIEAAETFFLTGMTEAIEVLVAQVHPTFPLTIYYAFKQSERADDQGVVRTGWETFLAAVVSAGLTIDGTWPVRTELANKVIGLNSNVLSSSIVIACRPRAPDARSVTRREFLGMLRNELPTALSRLQQGNIAPVDLSQAAIGPGMTVFTRHASVLDAEGGKLSIGEALAVINEAVDEVLAKQEGDFDRDTRWAITWFDEVGFAEADFGKAEQLSKTRNTVVAEMADPKRGAIIASGRGKVKLLKPFELDPEWDPATDQRLTVWEMVHHLIRVLEADGENAAAALFAKIGAKVEVARELAYRLYSICERKKRSAEAQSYNGLVQAWPEISRLARGLANASPAPAAPEQSSMDL